MMVTQSYFFFYLKKIIKWNKIGEWHTLYAVIMYDSDVFFYAKHIKQLKVTIKKKK